MNVVIADDERISREGLRDLVDWKSLGMAVVFCAPNGQEALDYIESNPVDLLITDIRMPKMDGLELLRRLSARPGAPSALILSGFNDFSYAQRAIKYGVLDYLLKPIRPAVLLEALKKVAQKRSMETGAEPGPEQYARFQAEDRAAAAAITEELANAVCVADTAAALARCGALQQLFMQKGYAGSLFRKYAFRGIYQCVDAAEAALGAGIPYFDDMQPMEQLSAAKDYAALLEQLRQCVGLLCACVEEAQAGQKKRLASEVIVMIRYRYGDADLSVASVAGELGITPNYLSSLFKKQTGKNFTEYLEEFRMDKARKLLGDVRYKVYEVATLCGYADAKHFARVFKANFNMTPNDFRRQAKDG